MIDTSTLALSTLCLRHSVEGGKLKTSAIVRSRRGVDTLITNILIIMTRFWLFVIFPPFFEVRVIPFFSFYLLKMKEYYLG